MRFLGTFDATVGLSHLPKPAFDGWESEYAAGTFKARVLHINPETKEVGLSMAPHVLGMHNAPADVAISSDAVGDVVDVAVVRRIDSRKGMMLELTEKDAPTFAYVHITNAFEAEQKDEGAKRGKNRLEKTFKVDSRYKCRITGFSPVDKLLLASLRESVVEATVMRYDQLVPAMEVRCTVTKVDTFGVLVSLGNDLEGLVTNMHLSDVRVREPKKHFKIGQTIRCAVLQLDSKKKKKVFLTHKRSLLRSKLPKLRSYEEAEVNMLAHGFITKIEKYGIIITFYDNVHGLVPTNVLTAEGISDPKSAYSVSYITLLFILAATFPFLLLLAHPRPSQDTTVTFVGGRLLRAWYIKGVRSLCCHCGRTQAPLSNARSERCSPGVFCAFHEGGTLMGYHFGAHISTLLA